MKNTINEIKKICNYLENEIDGSVAPINRRVLLETLNELVDKYNVVEENIKNHIEYSLKEDPKNNPPFNCLIAKINVKCMKTISFEDDFVEKYNKEKLEKYILDTFLKVEG